QRRAGPLFGAGLLIVAGALAFTPVVSPVGAIDPTPAPTAEVTPDPSSTPSPDPTATVAPSPTPVPSPEPTPSSEPSPDPTPSPEPSPTPSPDPTPTPAAPGLHVEHVWVDSTLGIAEKASPGALDAPRLGAERFRVYLVRFQVVNDADEAIELTPRLEFGVGVGASSFAPVPATGPAKGEPLYSASDDGKSFRVRTVALAAGELRRTTSDDATASPVAGVSFRGVNPGKALHLPGHSFTEVEFAVRATADAGWLTTYELRLVDARAALRGPAAVLALGEKPVARLSPGQRPGIRVNPPLAYRIDLAAFRQASAPMTRAYALLGPMAGFESPHTAYSLTTDACAACHASHTAQGALLIREPAPQATLCFGCHDGTGAVANTKAEYTDPTVPANDPATSSWYSHPATSASASAHVNDRDDEFGGRLERHAACADCHQPHDADGTLSVETTAGWTASGALKGASSVSVANGAAGTTPVYTLNPASALEYQLCFKCHSGFTQLSAQDPARPSRWALDKAVELNPANLSYHPVEAAGTNQTAAMAASLAGTSPYKLWSFQTTSTVRCVNCHGDSRQATPATPPAAGARLAPHAVKNQGLLMANYRMADLKLSSEGYQAADFALCYQCHAEEPFVDASGDAVVASSFRFHGLHISAIAGEGTGGLDIDGDGDGQGNAICAECHFRIHGTTEAVDGQVETARLVNFSPNVQPRLGKIEWVGATRTCTLVCHGKNHSGLTY
ncbi:MAG: cytochrome c3 family protein, partial [Chloroflexota bacterium]